MRSLSSKSWLTLCLTSTLVNVALACPGTESCSQKSPMTLDFHGSMGMGYYSIQQLNGQSTFNGLGLGYFFRPSLYAISSLQVGDVLIESTSGITIKPNASLLNQGLDGELAPAQRGFNLVDSADANFDVWTLSMNHAHYGKWEVGRSTTLSAQAGLASFSPFHRLRGGYEDALTTLTQGFTPITPNTDLTQVQGIPLIAYFGASGMLLDAPHVSYKTPDFHGVSGFAEWVPTAYLGDIGGVSSQAYAFGLHIQEQDADFKYDARVAYANNVFNGYPTLLLINQGVLDAALVRGSQINTSLAVGYQGFDASISYALENHSKTPKNPVDPLVNFSAVKPYIIEGTVGYSVENKYFGGKTSVQGTYTLAENYLSYLNSYVTGSRASMAGVGLGQFVGNMAFELRVQQYKTSNNILNKSATGNIISFGTMYLF